MTITKNGQPILDLAHWSRVAGPKSAHQWAEGRSAMEVARYWLAAGATLPPLLAEPLGRHDDVGIVTAWHGEPEVRLAFDSRKGEPRNTDLLLECEDPRGPFLIAVEAKVDETFGETVEQAVAAALDRRLSNPRSQAYERVLDLAIALLPPRQRGLPSIGGLRYQLLTASAGALAEGKRRGLDRVVLCVQVFRTKEANQSRLQENEKDLDAFVKRLSGGRKATLGVGEVAGPFTVPGAPLLETPANLYILKVVHELR